MNHEQFEYLTWVVVEGEMRNVSEFAALAPEDRPAAACPQCDAGVTMKLGSIVAHHAAHKPGSACPMTQPESILHLNAKLHLASKLREMATLTVEDPCQLRLTGHRCSPRQHAWVQGWDEVVVERRVGTRRPDVLLLKGGEPLAAIEVLVTHAVDDQKAADLRALGLPWIEVRGESVWTAKDVWQGGPLRAHAYDALKAEHVCAACALLHEEREKLAEIKRLTDDALLDAERLADRQKYADYLARLDREAVFKVQPKASYLRIRVVDVYAVSRQKPVRERLIFFVLEEAMPSGERRTSLRVYTQAPWQPKKGVIVWRTSRPRLVGAVAGGASHEAMATLTEAFKAELKRTPDRLYVEPETVIIDKPCGWMKADQDDCAYPHLPAQYCWKEGKWEASEKAAAKLALYLAAYHRAADSGHGVRASDEMARKAMAVSAKRVA